MDAYRNGRSLSHEYRMVHEDGHVVWVREQAFVIRDEDGEPWLIQGVIFDITERKIAEEQIAFLAYHDKLTGLPNRLLFEEMLELAVACARRHELSVGVLFLDLDNFKLVNDSLGHHAGDELLAQLADRLRVCTRDTDLVARQGGDEFLVLLSDLERDLDPALGADPALVVAESVAARVRDALAESRSSSAGRISMRRRASASACTRWMRTTPTCCSATPTPRCTRARNPGRARGCCTPRPATTRRTRSRSRRACAGPSRTRTGCCTTSRSWSSRRAPSAGSRRSSAGETRAADLAPGEFIPLAEELGLIEAIGDWVLDELARQDVEWRRLGIELDLGCNLSPRQLWSPHLAEKILAKLGAVDLDPRCVVVEITESTAMSDPDRTQKILTELHAWGLRLAIDDVGTGYSSLSRLNDLPVDVLKIDRTSSAGSTGTEISAAWYRR